MIRDVCARESYTDSAGTEKVSWNKIGILIDKGDKTYIKLFHMPGSLLSVFEQKKKNEGSQESQESQKSVDLS